MFLRIFSNCSYLQLQSDVTTSSSLRFCSVQGQGQYSPWGLPPYLDCSATQGLVRSGHSINCCCCCQCWQVCACLAAGNSPNWRTSNLPINSSVAVGQYGGWTLPTECRPFPGRDGGGNDHVNSPSSTKQCTYLPLVSCDCIDSVACDFRLRSSFKRQNVQSYGEFFGWPSVGVNVLNIGNMSMKEFRGRVDEGAAADLIHILL